MSRTSLCFINFPKELTHEEKELKSKYELLRKLKQKIKRLQKKAKNKEHQESSISTNQDHLKKTALQVLKANGGDKKASKNVTKDFKKSSKPNGEVQFGQKRSAMGEYTPEREPRPRSVIVRGLELTHEFLYKYFKQIGRILQIKMDQSGQSAIITFKKFEKARSAADVMKSCCIEGKHLSVELMKKRNTTWLDISTADSKNKKYDYGNREKRTIHVSFEGNLTMKDFRNIFKDVGKIEKMYLSSLNSTLSAVKPFAFITFEYEDEARRALDEKDGFIFNGIHLTISPQKVNSNDASISSNPNQEKDSRDLITFHDDDLIQKKGDRKHQFKMNDDSNDSIFSVD
ncbi:negative elongation factor E [Caerostris darwini]|uniref:Negative elongation factor E n=2 Tax=Caerostris darwini TaxID=1538125 RepID=A0AAV4T193_9ARAC|nr:negative elongation factor E [Caerostris darwini]